MTWVLHICILISKKNNEMSLTIATRVKCVSSVTEFAEAFTNELCIISC
jgi:hypothetical protein